MNIRAELNEGTEALTRFEETMKKLFAAKKKDLPPSPFGKSGKARKKADAKVQHENT